MLQTSRQGRHPFVYLKCPALAFSGNLSDPLLAIGLRALLSTLRYFPGFPVLSLCAPAVFPVPVIHCRVTVLLSFPSRTGTKPACLTGGFRSRSTSCSSSFFLWTDPSPPPTPSPQGRSVHKLWEENLTNTGEISALFMNQNIAILSSLKEDLGSNNKAALRRWFKCPPTCKNWNDLKLVKPVKATKIVGDAMLMYSPWIIRRTLYYQQEISCQSNISSLFTLASSTNHYNNTFSRLAPFPFNISQHSNGISRFFCTDTKKWNFHRLIYYATILRFFLAEGWPCWHSLHLYNIEITD